MTGNVIEKEMSKKASSLTQLEIDIDKLLQKAYMLANKAEDVETRIRHKDNGNRCEKPMNSAVISTNRFEFISVKVKTISDVLSEINIYLSKIYETIE